VSETLVKENNPNLRREATSDGECDERGALNHVDGDHGDRQSSRHGSRRDKNRSRSGTNRKNNVCQNLSLSPFVTISSRVGVSLIPPSMIEHSMPHARLELLRDFIYRISNFSIFG
jgi:hypothetical protein